MYTKRSVSIMFLIFTLLTIYGVNATGQDTYVVKENEVLFGTWINTDYNETWRYAKIIMKPKNTWDEYKWSYSEGPVLYGEFTINDKWTDSDGYTFYKITLTASGPPYYVLLKIDNTGNVYEDVWSTLETPADIDPQKNAHYRIYYRQE